MQKPTEKPLKENELAKTWNSYLSGKYSKALRAIVLLKFIFKQLNNIVPLQSYKVPI